MFGLLQRNKHGEFIYRPSTPDETKLAEDAGMTFSTSAKVYFTNEPYAALPFFEQGDGAAKNALDSLWREYQQSFAISSNFQVPAPDDRELMPFQRAGVEYALARKHCLIGDQPGLGKTIQAIGLSNILKTKRNLVICPANVRLNWRREIMGWSTKYGTRAYPILKSSDGVNPHADWLIVSYDLARSEQIHAALMQLEFDMLVMDEAHYLKTPEAQRTRSIFGGGEGQFEKHHLASRADRTLTLTGTPLPNRPRECYTIARSQCWESIDWQSEEKFKHRYNPSFKWPTGRVEERVGRLPELQARLRCNFMVRRMKREVLKQLPDKTYELAFVEPNAKVRKVLQAENHLVGMSPEQLRKAMHADPQLLGHISTLRREMGEAIAPLAVDHVAFLLDGGVDKLVIFAHHNGVIGTLVEGLRRFGVVYVNGSTTPVQREARKQQFIDDPDIRCFVGQLQAAGIGIDGLQGAASMALFPEYSWVPGENEQCIDRLHRIGQKSSVLAQFLVAPGSLGEKMISNMIDKAHDIHGALDKRFGT